MALFKEKLDIDMCAVQYDELNPALLDQRMQTSYEFICDGIQFFLDLHPDGENTLVEVSSQITYMPFTVEDVHKRLFFLNLLNMLSMKLGAPFMIQNERYVFFKKTLTIEGKADIAHVMHQTYNIVLAYLPYMKIFKSR